MIELVVHGDPEACRAAAQSGRAAAEALEAQVAVVRRATCDAWTGSAAEAYRTSIADTSSAMADLVDRLTPACRALDDLAGELDAVRSRMDEVRSRASGAGLVVSGDAVQPPEGGGTLMTVEQAAAHDARVAEYDAVFGIAEDARGKERDAHDRAVKAMEASTGDGLAEDLLERLGFVTPDGMDGVAAAGYLAGLAGLGFGSYAGWRAKAVHGVWQPRFRTPEGRWQWGSNQGWSRADRLRLSLRRGASQLDWRAKAHHSVPRARWEAAGRWANRAGGVVTGLTSAWSQWEADADDPALDTGERVDRTLTKGGLAGGGAWGGATAGAWLGGAIGTAIFPGAGTVVGGAIGGLVGGAVGAYAGSELADWVNEGWDGAGHAVGELAGAAAEGLTDVGDALTFWD